MLVDLEGYCPMGCGRTLHASSNTGFVVCLAPNCPDETAATKLLCEVRNVEHLVNFAEEGFDIQHPLRERLNGVMFDCGLHLHVKSWSGPPAHLGLCTAIQTAEGVWQFTKASD